jgi:hypothetical protein
MVTLEPQYFVDTVYANVNNEKLSDEEFREFVRTTLTLYMTPNQRKLIDDRMAWCR